MPDGIFLVANLYTFGLSGNIQGYGYGLSDAPGHF